MNWRPRALGSRLTRENLFEGVKHSHVPDLEAPLKGKVPVTDPVVQGVELSWNSVQVVDAKMGARVSEAAKGEYSD